MIQIVPISQTSPLFEKQAATAEKDLVSGLPFADILKESMEQMQETQKISNQDAYDLAMGNTDDIARKFSRCRFNDGTPFGRRAEGVFSAAP